MKNESKPLSDPTDDEKKQIRALRRKKRETPLTAAQLRAKMEKILLESGLPVIKP